MQFEGMKERIIIIVSISDVAQLITSKGVDVASIGY